MSRGGRPSELAGKKPKAASSVAADRGGGGLNKGLVVGAVVGLLLVVAAVLGVVFASSGDETSAESGGAATPAAAGPDGLGIAVGPSDADVVLDVYEDPQCPACAQFEEALAPTLDDLAASGEAQINYVWTSFINAGSARAVNALGCAADVGVDEHQALRTEVFAAQDQTGRDGFTDEQLLALGQQVGLGDDFERCVTSDEFGGWVERTQAAATDTDLPGTPTVRVRTPGTDLGDARQLEDSEYTDKGLRAAVAGVSADD